MPDAIAYDKAKWHYEGNYPAELPERQAFVHIGFMLGWAAQRGLLDEEFFGDFRAEVESFSRRELTGPRLLQICDGALCNDMLSAAANEFLSSYYDPTYFQDYEACFKNESLPTLYHVADTWSNFDRVTSILDQRFQEWQSRRN